jgi:glycosyltransferase involved in cell wall biosynthesis
LPLAEAFDSPAKPDPLLERVPYFVVCGTVEPRKNHLLLLDVWRQLCALPGRAPQLVVIGSLGWRGGSILDQMLRCETTHGQIHHVQGLSTQAMKSLIAGSRGLLSPSFAEGFGLPIIEALHLGAPVLASDIPAHREVAGQNAILLDPLDSPAWRRAISGLNSQQSQRQPTRPPDEARHAREACLSSVDEFLDAV